MGRRRLLYWFAVAVWMVVIFCFSHQAHSNEITKEYFGDFNYWVRKGAHVSEYAGLFLLARLASRSTPIAFAVSVLYACTDEWHQTFVAGRTGTPSDVLIDSIGPAIMSAAFAVRDLCRRKAASK